MNEIRCFKCQHPESDHVHDDGADPCTSCGCLSFWANADDVAHAKERFRFVVRLSSGFFISTFTVLCALYAETGLRFGSALVMSLYLFGCIFESMPVRRGR